MSSVFRLSDRHEVWMREDLAKSGIEPEDLAATAHPGAGSMIWPNADVADREGKKESQSMGAWVTMHYTIPYWTPEGEPLANVVIRKPRFKEDTPWEIKEQKYARPSRRIVGDLAVVPYMHPGRLDRSEPVLDIHEGEKKTACAVKHGQCAIGIGGCHSWGDPERKGHLHPWIAGEIARIQKAHEGQRVKVRLWADADYKTNPNVAHGYSGLASALTALDVEVVIMDMSPLRPGAKFDDLVAERGYYMVMILAVEESTQTLPENPESLVRRYRLLSQPVGKGPDAKQVPQAILENVITILEKHPRFIDSNTGESLMWLDRDKMKPMFGGGEFKENVGDVETVRFFQRQLGFNGSRKVTLDTVREAIAHRLAMNERSPFNDRVRAAAERLREAGPQAMKAANDALDSWVPRYLHATDTEFNRRWGRKFLLSIVARALRPGCFMRTAYVLAGPQDIGKSYFMSSILGEDNVRLVSGDNSHGKDLAMLYSSCLVAVHDEMQAMTSRGIQAVKSDISTNTDSIRPPYGRVYVDMKRRCVFLIPVDRVDFLFEDAAGMTRFAVLNLLESHTKGQRFDFPGLAAVADDLLGAAWLAVEAGEVFDVVEGAEDSARPHLKADLTMEQIERVIEEKLWVSSHRGAYKGRAIVGFLLSELADQMPHGYKANGGGSTVLTGPLRKLGFEQAGPDVKVAGFRKLWFMDEAVFNEKFNVKREKFDA